MHCCALQDRQVGGEREWSPLSIGNAPSIWKESAHCEGNLFLSELFHSNLQHNLPSHCLSLKLIQLRSLANEDEGIWCEGLEKTTCPQNSSHRAMTASKRWWACLQWISLTAQLHHNRCIHTARDRKSYWDSDVHALFKACNNWMMFSILSIWLCSMHSRDCWMCYSQTSSCWLSWSCWRWYLTASEDYLIWSALVPKILARSYFVMYLVVMRGLSLGWAGWLMISAASSCMGSPSPSSSPSASASYWWNGS